MKKRYTQEVHIERSRINEFADAVTVAPHYHNGRGIELPLDNTVFSVTYKDGSVIKCDVVIKWNEISNDERPHLKITRIAPNGKLTDEKNELIFSFRHFLEMMDNLTINSGRNIYETKILIGDGDDAASLSSILKRCKCVFSLPEEHRVTVIADKETIDNICMLLDYDVGHYNDEVRLYNAMYEDGTVVTCHLKYGNDEWRLSYEYERDGCIGGYETLVNDADEFRAQLTDTKIIIADSIYRIDTVLKHKNTLIPAQKLFTDKRRKEKLLAGKVHIHSLLCTIIIFIISAFVYSAEWIPTGKIIWAFISGAAMTSLLLSSVIKATLGIIDCFENKRILSQCGIGKRAGKTVREVCAELLPIGIAVFVCMHFSTTLWPTLILLKKIYHVYAAAFSVWCVIAIIRMVSKMKAIITKI